MKLVWYFYVMYLCICTDLDVLQSISIKNIDESKILTMTDVLVNFS